MKYYNKKKNRLKLNKIKLNEINLLWLLTFLRIHYITRRIPNIFRSFCIDFLVESQCFSFIRFFLFRIHYILFLPIFGR